MRTWHLITGAYPPQAGGVSDYTQQLCRALARAGDTAHVWASDLSGVELDTPSEPGIVVHRLPGGFGVPGLFALGSRLAAEGERPRLLVQYVPHAFGYRGMNLPFCAWLAAQRRERVWVMFHEAVFPFGERPHRTNLLALATHAMAGLLVNRADRVLVSTPAWERYLRPLSLRRLEPDWVPIPSNLPTAVEPGRVAELRRRLLGDHASVLIGHFGTYGAHVAALVHAAVPSLLEGRAERRLQLFGRGSEPSALELCTRHPALASRIGATGPLSPEDLVSNLAACDVLLQPYADGASTRRTSLMAGLALAIPVVSNQGPLTEPEWAAWGAVALAPDATPLALAREVERLLASPTARTELGARAVDCYRQRFSMDHTVTVLSRLAAEEES